MSKNRVRFLMIGGFLGAGKTTTIARLARMLQADGLNVGLVTNDQAADLVDTRSLRAQGFHVGEVAGACFCCNFNQLTETLHELRDDQRPDVVIAEPVGSCTDLVATVAQPIMQLWGHEFDVGPHAVIVKPSHGLRILDQSARAGFSPKAEYLFRKQLEEADLLLLNRVDELPAGDADRLERRLVENFPGRTVIRISAKLGTGFEQLVSALLQPGEYCRRILDLDYDRYAEAEAELGWLNGNVTVTSPRPFALDTMLVDVVVELRGRFIEHGIEPAHLKTIGSADDRHAVANLISSDTPVTLSIASGAETTTASLVVNARVATDPDLLNRLVVQSLRKVTERHGATLDIHSMNCFRPSRPVPTHRMPAP